MTHRFVNQDLFCICKQRFIQVDVVARRYGMLKNYLNFLVIIFNGTDFTLNSLTDNYILHSLFLSSLMR